MLTLTDDKLLKFVLILGEEERKFELRLFGEKSLAGLEPLLAYYSADFSVSHFLKFAISNEVANFKIPHPKNQLTSSAKPCEAEGPGFSKSMPQTQSINSISQNNSFIIIAAQSNFNHILCENVMVSAPEKALFS